MTPQRFRKKPIVIEAMQLTEDNRHEVGKWCGGRIVQEAKASDPTDVYLGIDIPTLEGTMRANLGDWVIKGIQGEFYPCRDDIFRASYEADRPQCGCYECWETWANTFTPPRFLDRMLVCPECGNKRCPKATWHGELCTHSNKPGQEGSRYGIIHTDRTN